MTGQAPRRVYKSDQYLRSEHLLRDGKYVAVNWTIKDVVYDCPKKKMGKEKGDSDGGMAKMTGIEFNESNGKVLGLNVTNESMVCWVTGQGTPSQWVGHKIMLVVRLIKNRQKNVMEPAIRVWYDRAKKPPPNMRTVQMLGDPVDDEWYENHGNVYGATTPGKPADQKPKDPVDQKPPQQKTKEQVEETPAQERARQITWMVNRFRDSKTPQSLEESRGYFSRLVQSMQSKGHQLTADEIASIEAVIPKFDQPI